MKIQRLLFVLLWSCLRYSASDKDTTSWKMTDRFYGFRFELHGKVHNVGFRQAAQAQAHLYGCFGWIQNQQPAKVVGEARCLQEKGQYLQKWLSTGPTGAHVEKALFKVYDSTKIRYHFTTFRILDSDQATCFKDSPHACSSLAPMDFLEAEKDEL